MTLRLSPPTNPTSTTTTTSDSISSTSSPASVDGYMKQIIDDPSLSLLQKNDCLKTLGVVLKNLIDSSKGGLAGESGLKYRTLKLDNPKLKARLFCSETVTNLLLDTSLVGMLAKQQQQQEGSILTMPEAPLPKICDAIGLKVLPAVKTAQQQIANAIANSNNNSNSSSVSKKAKLTELNGKQQQQHAPLLPKLSEKQKARLLMEQKAKLEKEREKQFRKETRAKIAADKLVRQKDENWKPTVSAAADKTGTGLLTFRDRHGE